MNDDLWKLAEQAADEVLTGLLRVKALQPHEVTPDLRQEALLAAGEAMQRWDPGTGPFYPFCLASVRLATLKTRTRERRRGVTGSWQMPAHVSLYASGEEFRSIEDALTYLGAVPAGFEDPHAAAETEQRAHFIRLALSNLPPQSADLIRRLYGIDRIPESGVEYANRHGITPPSVSERLAAALEQLAKWLPEEYKGLL